MPRYRKKPVVIEAWQFSPVGFYDNPSRPSWVNPMWLYNDGEQYLLMIPTLEGEMLAQEGDWIIKGVKGEVYPCKPDIFEATYDPAD